MLTHAPLELDTSIQARQKLEAQLQENKGVEKVWFESYFFKLKTHGNCNR